MTSNDTELCVEVTADLVGTRLDRAVAMRVPELSRARVRRLIDGGEIRVSGQRAKPSHRLRLGERVEGEIPEPEADRLEPEAIPLDVRYEDSHLLVVNKSAGLVVHPAAGQQLRPQSLGSRSRGSGDLLDLRRIPRPQERLGGPQPSHEHPALHPELHSDRWGSPHGLALRWSRTGHHLRHPRLEAQASIRGGGVRSEARRHG